MIKTLFILAIAFLPFATDAQNVGGTYFPTIIAHSAAINAIPQLFHYIKVDSEVFVWGSVFANGTPVANKRIFFIPSLPFPSDISGVAAAYGGGTVLQSVQPAIPCGVNNQGGQINVFWIPTASFPAQVFFSFAYTIK